MRAITAWRWIFGFALVPAALVLYADLDTAADAGALAWVAVFVIAYSACLVWTILLIGLAIGGAKVASSVGRFIAELFGLRG